MPLLHKKTFEPVEFPVDLRGSEEVFFCHTTGEIFRDYDDYCERIILCNSLVWSCSLTGRSNLTYSEAKASEEKIKKLLKQFPMELRIPVLYLASICERRSLVDLAEEVYNYVKDRFFIGETVQINVSGKGNVDGHVLSVIPPTKEELASLSRKTLSSDKHYPPASSYKYEIERHDNGEEIEATHDQISRPKLVYNKDKNRLYIKQFVHLVNGVWKLKDSSNAKYGINKIKFDQIFCGNPPDMNPKHDPKKKTAEKSKKQETINKYFKQTEKNYNISPKSNNRRKSEPIPNTKKVVRRRKPRSDKKSSEEEKKKLDRKENSKKYAEFVKEWSMKREDLECEDLKDMPGTTPVEGKIPNEHFGSVIMILEFLQSFNSVLALKDFFPHGVTLDLLERALLEREVAGPLCDIIQMLLSAIFDLRDQEEEVKEDTKINPADKFSKNGTESKILTMAKTSEYWIKRNHGVYLTQLTLDSSTLSEVLRLHLLSSGANPKTSKIAKWRYQARGGYLNHDDPAVTLKMTEPELLVKLADTNVNNLELEERLLIVECLINQILTYVGPREIIEEGCEQGKQARTEIRALNAKQARLDKAEALKQKELKKEGGSNTNKEKDEDKVKDLRSTEKETEVEALQRKVRETLGKVQLQPLGTDRAHRRFWVFPSFPGLFVEDDDSYKGECLPKRTPSVPFTNLDGDDIKYLKKLFEESGNKENFAGKQKTINYSSPSKKLLAEKNGSDSPVKSDVQKVELNKPLTCWADPVDCPVHGHASKRVTWSFYKDQSEIENLINSLNQRGVRERKLRQVLLQEKEKIIKSLKNCPFQKLNPSLASEENLVETRNKHVSSINKLYKNANLSYPAGTPLDEIQEKDLRHYLLELENKITAGALGTLKVKDLELWRDAILNGSYDKQCKKLTWGKGSGNNGNESDSEIEMEENENDEEKIDVENEDNDVIKEDEEEEGRSRSSTPSLEVSFEAPEKQGVLETVPQKPVILDLASAILQVAQSLDPSFLKRPLGFDPKERDRYDGTHSSSTMLRWERSLMKSTSFAQLYLRLATLESSIIWEKSAMKVYCRVCRSKEDPEQTLLCDTCNKGFHFYCLKPKLTKVPTGEWHCPRCKPKEKGAKRKRKHEESDEEDLEDCFCKVCNEKGAQIKCDECKSKLHLACVNPPLRKIPQSDWLWICHLCRLQNSQSAAEKKGLNDSKGEPAVKKEIKTEAAKEPKPRVKREKVEEKIQPVKKNGLTNHDDYMCEWRDSDRLSPDLERSSRRRSSKAATAKISHFAKQLRSTHWDEDGVVDETTEPVRPGRRSRRSVEVPKKTRDLPLDNAALQEILETLMHQDEAWPFLRPVTKVEVPDYHSIIKKPMDFGTIKHKLNMLQYTKNSELIADANLLFENCFLYNQEGSEVYKAGEELQELFYKLCEEHNLLKDLEPPLKKARTVLDS